MNIVLGERQTGRTTQIILRSVDMLEHGRDNYIVCPNSEMADYLQRLAREMKERGEIKFEPRKPVTAYEHISRRCQCELLIDNLEMTLIELFRHEVSDVSITGSIFDVYDLNARALRNMLKNRHSYI